MTIKVFRNTLLFASISGAMLWITCWIVFESRISRFGVRTSIASNFWVFFLLSAAASATIFLLVFFALYSSQKRRLIIIPLLLLVLLAGFALLDIWTGNFRFTSYGDALEIDDSITSVSAGGNPRWIFGVYVISLVRWVINTFIISMDPQLFVESLGTIVVIGTSMYVLIKSNGRAQYVLPLAIPIWLTFGTGYDEYQPFVAAITLVVLLLIFDNRPREEIFPSFLITGLLPAIYVGFLPLSIFYFLNRLKASDVRTVVRNLVYSVITYLIALEISWPSGNRNYFEQVKSGLSLGNDTLGAISGKAMNSRSMFFSLSSVLSKSHLEGVAYMTFLGGGIFGIGFLILKFVAAYSPGHGLSLRSIARTRLFTRLQKFVLAWALFYLVFLMAKLGPSGDIDAFYFSYFVFAIALGVSIDNFADRIMCSVSTKAFVIAWVASINAPMFVGLALLGVNQKCDLYSQFRSFC
jgi:hypothetical protein